MIKFGTSFELAFRRSLFSLFLILIYLLVASLVLSLIAQVEQSRKISETCKSQKEGQKERRLEFERTELLNTLWAELLASKSESEWSMIANAKLDSYDRLLIVSNNCHGNQCSSSQLLNKWNFPSTFRSTLLLLTTTGGGPLTEDSPEILGYFTKLFVSLFSLLGIPLFLIHLEHSAKALATLIEANFERNPKWALLVLAIFALLMAALVVDIVIVKDEHDEEKHSFLDSFFTVLLAFFTISGVQLHQIPLPLLLPILLFLHSLSNCFISTLIASLHRWLAPHEFAFANGFCGKIEKAVSGARLDQQEEKEQENQQPHWRGEVPILRFGIGDDDGIGELLVTDVLDDEDESMTTTFLAMHRKQSISTIEEEEGELNSQS